MKLLLTPPTAGSRPWVGIKDFLTSITILVWPVNSLQDCLNDCIYQIERAKEANGSSNPTFHQAVCNQRSENTNNTVTQQQQHLPSEQQVIEVETHQPSVPMTIAPSQAKNHQKTSESSSLQSGHPDSPERVTPTEVLEVDLLEVSWSKT